MEFLTRELTSIEKVRRNVILLAALAALLALFPVRTDEVTFFGAKFTSGVVAFGVFHALLFYTLVMASRALLQQGVVSFDGEAFDSQIEANIAAEQVRVAALRSETEQQRGDAVGQIEERIRRITHELDRVKTAQNTTGSVTIDERARAGWRAIGLGDSSARIRRLEAQRTAAINEQERLEAQIADEVGSRPHYRESRLRWHRTFARLLAVYVFVGEYLFPIVVGAAGCAMLLLSQQFPMVWQLSLRQQ